MNFVLLGVIFTGKCKTNLLPGQIVLIIMKSTKERRRQVIRSVALLHTLSKREGITSVYGFAEKYDALVSPIHLTQGQGKNGWQALFNGTRPVSATRLRALSTVHAWSDAIDLFENGPANLWKAMWGPSEQLRLVIADELTEWRNFDQAVAEFERELLLAQKYHAPLALLHLAKAIAFYRLQNEILGLGDASLSYGVAQCLCNEVLQGDMECLGVRPAINEELVEFFSTKDN